MTDSRWVVIGYAPPRTAWFRDVARWATSATLPIDYVTCLSAAEVESRLRAGRPHSALLVDARATDADRALVEQARHHDTPVFIVDRDDHDWIGLGAATRLAPGFTPDDLGVALDRHARPVPSVPSPTALGSGPAPTPGPTWRGRLVAVTGAGGVGVSTVAQGLATTLAAGPGHRAMVALADLALHADQAMRHDTGDLVPGIQELCEAHGRRQPPVDIVRRHLFDIPDGGYHLLLGLRRHRDWTALRPPPLRGALDGLLRSYRLVVAQVDPDLEGEAETGSADIEDRNAMARCTMERADVAVVVGMGTAGGLHALRRAVADLVRAGVDPVRIVATANRMPRRPAARAGWSRGLASLLRSDPDTASGAEAIGNPVFLGESRSLERAVRDGASPGAAWCRPLATEVCRRLAHVPPLGGSGDGAFETSGARVVPGSIGSRSGRAP